jgi:adenine phosphoribosyltransferase
VDNKGLCAILLTSRVRRGFLFGPIIALALGVGFVALRKPGKLPGNVLKVTYMKEYGPDTIELQEGLLKKGARVLIVDDLLVSAVWVPTRTQQTCVGNWWYVDSGMSACASGWCCTSNMCARL